MAGEPGFEPGRTVLETVRLPLSYSPIVTGCLRVLALAFTLMVTYAPLSFPPVWSCILDLNQGSSRYQHAALPTAPMHVEASPVPIYCVTGHRETDYILYISKLTLYLTLLYIEFSSQGCISFQLAWARDCRHLSAPCSHSHIRWIL